MTKKPKADYPRKITGSMLFTSDDLTGIPEIEVAFCLDVDSKGNRRVVYTSARMPSRFMQNIKPTYFEDSKCIVEYNDKNLVYSIVLNSIDSFIDRDTSEAKQDSEIDKYAKNAKDPDLAVILGICQIVWSCLEDNFGMIDLSGNFIKEVAKAFIENEEEDDLGMDM